jgi:hypothetical protein
VLWQLRKGIVRLTFIDYLRPTITNLLFIINIQSKNITTSMHTSSAILTTDGMTGRTNLADNREAEPWRIRLIRFGSPMAQHRRTAPATAPKESARDNISIICTVRHMGRYGNASHKLHSGSAFNVTER